LVFIIPSLIYVECIFILTKLWQFFKNKIHVTILFRTFGIPNKIIRNTLNKNPTNIGTMYNWYDTILKELGQGATQGQNQDFSDREGQKVNRVTIGLRGGAEVSKTL
jgi:hypothetical protein